MSYREIFVKKTVAISISESADMALLGLSEEHLRDAMVEIARHMLALGAKLIYGGDLRQYGFSNLLFELVSRHRRDSDEEQLGVINYLAWPVHMLQDVNALKDKADALGGAAELVLLSLNGSLLTMDERQQLSSQHPTEADWSEGLSAMRHMMAAQSHAKILLGGRVDQFKGCMPGVAEEAYISLINKQPLFLIGGFGGCVSDIANVIGIEASQLMSSRWPGIELFKGYSYENLNNGLTYEENVVLAKTPFIDQVIILVLKGLMNIFPIEKKGD